MARLAAPLVRRAAREPSGAAEDLGSRLQPQRHRHRRRLSPARRARARRSTGAGDRGLRSVDARRVRLLAVSAVLSLLAACTNQAPEQEAEETEIPEELARAAPAVVAAAGL